jgi:ComF family protein
MQIFNFLDDILSIAFPKLCISCGDSLTSSEAHICLECQIFLPQTQYHLHSVNPLHGKLNDLTKIENAAALYFFAVGGNVQKLIHQLKYKDKREANVEIGRYYGQILAKNSSFQQIDYIVPVPMHTKKLRIRGYNQAERFASGLSVVMGIAVRDGLLYKNKMTESQTLKSVGERFINSEGIYEWSKSKFLFSQNTINKECTHLLLVDDVITTGATISACSNAILETMPNARISVAAIAAVQY